MATIRLDLTGLKCPLPALKTRKALAALDTGDILDVRCTDPMAAIDIPHLVNQTGDLLLGAGRDDTALTFQIEKVSI